MQRGRSLRVVAVFEAAKGALVLLAGFGLFEMAHAHAQHVGEHLVRHLHGNPASSHPRIFERVLAELTDARLRLLGLGALAYAAIRFIEAWGLWRARGWAQCFAVVSGAVYLPFEVYEIFHSRSWAAVVVFAVNVLIVGVVFVVWRRGRLG